MPRRTRTRLSTALLASCTVALSAAAPSALAQDFYDGEILMSAANYPDGAGGTLRGIVRFDPVNMSCSLLYGTTTSILSEAQFTYDPYRDAVIVDRGNSPLINQIDSSGTLTSFSVSFNNIYGLTAGGPEGQIYGAVGTGLVYIDSSNTLQPLLDTNGVDQYTPPDGIDASSPSGFGLSNAMYYDHNSNSLFYTQTRNLGPGLDETFIRKVELNSAGTQVTSVTSVQVNVAPNSLDYVSAIGPGPANLTGKRISFSLNINNSDPYARAFTLETNTMTPQPYAEMGFIIGNNGSIPGCGPVIYSAASLDDGLYSPLTDSFMMYHANSCPETIGMWEYSYGAVDLSGTPDDIMPMDYVIRHMTVVETGCAADINGDGILDNGDIISFINLFLTKDLAVDLNGDGVIDNGDLGTFITAFLAGC